MEAAMPIGISRLHLFWIVVFSANGLAGVKFVSTFKDPSVLPVSFQGQKVAAFVMTLQNDLRIPAEDALAKEMTRRGVAGIAGHTLVPQELTKETEAVRQLLEKAGVRGAVVMRIVGLASDITTTANTQWYTGLYYPSFYGYYGYAMTSPYTVSQTTIDTRITVEVLAYSVDEDKRLWAGRCETKAPRKLEDFFKEIVGAAGKELRKAGVVKK